VKDDIDPGFSNDNYWLLLPFHFSWDTNAAVENAGVQKLPLGNGSAEKAVVKYPSDGGYSPGDTWEVYVGSDGRIEEMGYHRGGTPRLAVFATWTDYKKAGPLLFSLDHCGTRNGDPLHLFFSNVAVTSGTSHTLGTRFGGPLPLSGREYETASAGWDNGSGADSVGSVCSRRSTSPTAAVLSISRCR